MSDDIKKIAATKQLKRLFSGPLDPTSTWTNLYELGQYLKDPTCYANQLVVCNRRAYIIVELDTGEKALLRLGSGSGGGEIVDPNEPEEPWEPDPPGGGGGSGDGNCDCDFTPIWEEVYNKANKGHRHKLTDLDITIIDDIVYVPGYHIGVDPPNNTKLLWLDTSDSVVDERVNSNTINHFKEILSSLFSEVLDLRGEIEDLKYQIESGVKEPEEIDNDLLILIASEDGYAIMTDEGDFVEANIPELLVDENNYVILSEDGIAINMEGCYIEEEDGNFRLISGDSNDMDTAYVIMSEDGILIEYENDESEEYSLAMMLMSEDGYLVTSEDGYIIDTNLENYTIDKLLFLLMSEDGYLVTSEDGYVINTNLKYVTSMDQLMLLLMSEDGYIITSEDGYAINANLSYVDDILTLLSSEDNVLITSEDGYIISTNLDDLDSDLLSLVYSEDGYMIVSEDEEFITGDDSEEESISIASIEVEEPATLEEALPNTLFTLRDRVVSIASEMDEEEDDDFIVEEEPVENGCCDHCTENISQIRESLKTKEDKDHRHKYDEVDGIEELAGKDVVFTYHISNEPPEDTSMLWVDISEEGFDDSTSDKVEAEIKGTIDSLNAKIIDLRNELESLRDLYNNSN